MLFLYQLSTDRKFAQGFVDAIERAEENEQQNLLNNSDDQMMTMGFEESPLKGEKDAKKIKVEVKNGIAYLRPSQVMYVEMNNSKKELMTVDEDVFEIKESLTKVTEKLNGHENERFFSTKNAILNCNYIQQLIQESKQYNGKYLYQYFAIMQNKAIIKISEDKHKELKNLLNELF